VTVSARQLGQGIMVHALGAVGCPTVGASSVPSRIAGSAIRQRATTCPRANRISVAESSNAS
jgi:hypothetical protein